MNKTLNQSHMDTWSFFNTFIINRYENLATIVFKEFQYYVKEMIIDILELVTVSYIEKCSDIRHKLV